MLLAFLAGVVTLLNPCVLPILPILAATATSEDRFGPLAFAGGLIFSFATFGILILTVGFSIGLNQETLRTAAAILLVVAGVVLLVPRAQVAFAALVGPVASRGAVWVERVSGRGLHGQALLGALMGIVWTPCVGPTLGVAIAAASQRENLPSAFLTFAVFGVGVAVSMLALVYALRGMLATRRNALRVATRWSRAIFGGALLLVGVAILADLDKAAEAAALELMPGWLIRVTTQF
jgi:cytochrome c biogenesis protein CcdA